jgi:hypothetical protein
MCEKLSAYWRGLLAKGPAQHLLYFDSQLMNLLGPELPVQ